VVLAHAARLAGVRAVYCGDGVEREAVMRANPNAEFTGWIGADELRSVVRGARAVVNASLWYETQGLSVLEAAAQGIPAVVPVESAMRDAVSDDREGLLFRNGDVDDLAAKLRSLAGDPALAARLGTAAYDRFWAQPLDPETHMARLEAIYARALAPSAGER
jgi:glycosyltransferase involved in cell wall biosynthesis